MKLVKPNYKSRTPVVNDMHFSDAGAGPTGNPPLTLPGIGSPQDTFNPGQASEALPSGPPKYIQPAGKRVMGKGLTNKRLPANNV